MTTRAVGGETSTGLIAFPRLSTGTSGTSWSISRPAVWISDVGADGDHPDDDRLRPGDGDLARVHLRLAEGQAIGDDAMIDTDVDRASSSSGSSGMLATCGS